MSVQVIVQPPATLVLQQDVTSANVTQETTRTLEIVTAGPQGPRGVDGADGAAGAAHDLLHDFVGGVGVADVTPRGVDGADGAAGANGDGQYPVIEFAFGDASPAIVLTLNPASAAEVALVQLEIEEAFDGAGASIAVGTVADPDGLMRADQNLPGEVAVLETSPRVRLPAGEGVQLTITPGAGASQGRGKLIIQATPTA